MSGGLITGLVVFGAIAILITRVIPENPFEDKGKKANSGKRLIGQLCNENSDCSMKGIVESSEGGNLTSYIGCCDGTCKVRENWIGNVPTCRKEGEAAPEIENMARYYLYGSNYIYDTKGLGGNCKVDSDCGRYGMPHNAPADGKECGCYKGLCTFKKLDWAGALNWPDECRGLNLDSGLGTCNNNTNRTESEIKYRTWWAEGMHDNPGLQPKYKPSMTKEELEKYFVSKIK